MEELTERGAQDSRAQEARVDEYINPCHPGISSIFADGVEVGRGRGLRALITGRILTSASKVRNQGSASAGIFEASSRLTMSMAVRWPLISVKKAVSGRSSSRMRFILAEAEPSLMAALKVAWGRVACNRTRMGVSFFDKRTLIRRQRARAERGMPRSIPRRRGLCKKGAGRVKREGAGGGREMPTRGPEKIRATPGGGFCRHINKIVLFLLVLLWLLDVHLVAIIGLYP